MNARIDLQGAAASLEEIIDTVIDTVVRDLDVAMPLEQIHAETSIAHDLGIDSVALLGLVAALEKRFGIELVETVLGPGTFRTVRSVAEGIATSIAALKTA
jgi:acyl carrier protein